jgi:hypothetical protein
MRTGRSVAAAWLSAVCGVVGLSTRVLASTPQGGGPITAEPEVSPLAGLLGVAAPFAGIAIAILIVIGLAILVARIGGPAVDARERPRSRPAAARTVLPVVAVLAVVLGVLVGRAIAYEASHGGFAAIGAAVLSVLLVLLVVGMTLIGLIATKIRHGQISRAIATILSASALLAVSAVGGGVTARATGGTYQEPIVLEAIGETTFALDAGPLPFVPTAQGRADCRSAPDGRTVVEVAARDLGELGSWTLRASVALPTSPSEPATAAFFIDAGDLAEGSVQPFWSGHVLLASASADQASGHLAFDGLGQEIDPKMPAPGSSAAAAAARAWPATISGQLTWNCQPWQ